MLANSQTFERMGAVAFALLGRRVHTAGGLQHLDAELQWALEWWSEYLQKASPRFVPLVNLRKPLVVFTDGACEPNPEEPFGTAAGYG